MKHILALLLITSTAIGDDMSTVISYQKNTAPYEPIFCDVCGTEMGTAESGTLQGIEIKVTDTTEKPHPEITRMVEVFGKTEFHICFVDWLKGLGVKPKAAP